MIPIHLHVVRDLDEAGRLAAREILERLPREGVLGIATGSSPMSTYVELGRSGRPLAGVRSFALDEYVGLPASHPASYARVVRDEIAPAAGLRPEAILVPGRLPVDEAEQAEAFEAALAAAGGVDVQVAGIGRNGHLAFNEPGSAPDSSTRVVELHEQTRLSNARFFANPAVTPTHAITQGLGTILRARAIVLIACGEAKAAALAAAFVGETTPEVPASVLQQHPDVVVVADQAAARSLTGSA